MPGRQLARDQLQLSDPQGAGLLQRWRHHAPGQQVLDRARHMPAGVRQLRGGHEEHPPGGEGRLPGPEHQDQRQGLQTGREGRLVRLRDEQRGLRRQGSLPDLVWRVPKVGDAKQCALRSTASRQDDWGGGRGRIVIALAPATALAAPAAALAFTPAASSWGRRREEQRRGCREPRWRRRRQRGGRGHGLRGRSELVGQGRRHLRRLRKGHR
mmetsp:Transcript_103072/g.322507  ORF Transcript_103072/g.322507 Transcript_103072/m.322507 type:complete len:212 (+) Transcript_103072:114-749(+)